MRLVNAGPGRPPKPTVDTIDPAVMALARDLLDDAARSRRAFRAAPVGRFRRAVLAVRLSEALDALAPAEVRDVRDGDEAVSWAQIGDAFGTTAQGAHRRFS